MIAFTLILLQILPVYFFLRHILKPGLLLVTKYLLHHCRCKHTCNQSVMLPQRRVVTNIDYEWIILLLLLQVFFILKDIVCPFCWMLTGSSLTAFWLGLILSCVNQLSQLSFIKRQKCPGRSFCNFNAKVPLWIIFYGFVQHLG